MTYATNDSMLLRYGDRAIRELTDKDRQAGAIVLPVLQEAVDFGNGRVDGALLAGGHSPSLVLTDPVLVRHAESLARWSLSTGERPQSVIDDYEAAMKDLDRIARRQWFPDGTLTEDEAPNKLAAGTRTMRFGETETTAWEGMRGGCTSGRL